MDDIHRTLTSIEQSLARIEQRQRQGVRCHEGVTFGELLRKARQSRGLSASDFAERIGCTKQRVYQLESSSTDPRLSTATRCANALGIQLEDIIP